ncbi:putative nuclease HARBI1 [Eupeodes corollae]|uniref:putative nuclease HARBI1 n=1 Tax=Eupeodes corollae TaxID=290404 RepID=UPI002490FDEA|nr:putative nuclease HARBI1 [Eupeodes corollae]
MNEDSFKELLSIVQNSIQKRNSVMREAIPAEESLAMVLRFLATGETFRSLDFQTRLSRSHISNVMIACCKAIYDGLRNKYLEFPSTVRQWEEIANSFENKWQFPLCLGALDGKHIAFRAAKTDGAYYYNYKGFNSIVLLAMCDATYKFTYIDIGCNGRINDAGVLNRGDLRGIIDQAHQYFPPDKVIGNNKKLPYVIIGDDAFALEKHVLKPYPYNSKEESKKIFNFRLSHARQTIEHAFGMLANRFRVFQTEIHLRPEKVQEIVRTCCLLHNFLLTKNGNSEFPSAVLRSGEQQETAPNTARNPQKLASSIRDTFADYFQNEGELPWQYQYI